jgi:chloramphenicol 3-O phosphotransferase
MQSRVIVLNGVGSVGKSSTAKALQMLSRETFLHVEGDAFLDMMSPRLWGDPAGIIFERTQSDGQPSIKIEMGSALDRLMDGMRRSVAALAKAGNSCIVDDVMLSASDQKAYLDACSGIPIQFVALRAPLEIIEQRERERGDRLIGLARWQFPRVHKDIAYDFEVDTTTGQPKDIARAIASALQVSLS